MKSIAVSSTKANSWSILPSCILVIVSLLVAQSSAQPVEDYSVIAKRISEKVKNDSVSWNRLAELCDRFGHRFSGSQSLEHAKDWLIAKMSKSNLDKVWQEKVMVPAWSRGEESCEMLSPRQLKLPVLGLGGTVATDADGVDGEVVVVHSWDELKSKSSQIKGKIVLYNVPFTEYGKTVQYRVRGAIEASRHGAIGSLLRSVGPFGIQTPHTGSMGYNDSFPKTPHGAITLEHAEMIDRIISRGETVRVRLKTSGKWLEDSPSSNVLCELTGSEKPNEVVVIGGHIDSWDVGSGAMDDGGGCMISWRALEILKELGLKPRRTIRCVFWTNEENGLRGGNAYAKAHETEKHVAAIESDDGVFEPIGFGVEGSDKEIEFLRTLSPLFQSLFSNGKSLEIKKGGGGADISPLTAKGVPSLGLNVDETKYFWYHHTEGDTPDKLIPEEMNRCVATMAIMAYLLADMPTVFGR